MKNSGLKWTPQQLQAIETAGRDVYVTASAGTGKTAVLSARCIDLMNKGDKPADITEFVVLTFTEAAAEEMKSRIGELMRKLYLQTRDERLRGQLLRLDAAQISTIHSFCQSLIREYFYVLGIDPTFGIIADDEQKLIKARVLKEVVEEAFNDSAMSQGITTLLYGRNVMAGGMGFLDEVIKIHQFLDSTTSRDKWYESAEGFAGEGITGVLAQRQKDMVLEKLAVCRAQLSLMEKLDEKLAEGHWAEHLQTEMMPAVEELIQRVMQEKAGWTEAVRDFVKPKFKNKPKEVDGDLAKIIKAPAVSAFDTIKKMGQLAIINPRYEEIVAGASSGQTKVLLELVKRFEKKYRQTKDNINCLDFADLEHYALKLLTESDEIAGKLRDRFRYVFVDEFQDVNPLQEKIISTISRSDNMFVVGDVKQSIYAFRHSDPSIFIDRLKKANTDEESAEPMRVDLSDNFRSRAGVLEFANKVFERVMSETVGGVEYDERAALKAGFGYNEIDGPLVQIDVIDEAEEEKADSEVAGGAEGVEQGYVSAPQRQAAMIAGRIQQLISDETQVYDKSIDGYRNVRYGDIVILMRSLSKVGCQYVELLRKAGIPVKSQSSAGYFEATEITDMLSLLKVLDNPQRDVELAAVLRSPMFNITDTELAIIRAHGDKLDEVVNFYRCVVEYSVDGNEEELREKINAILETLDGWRSIGRRGQLSDMVWKVYRQTGYLAFVSGIASGKQRYANLLKLHDRAIQFEGFADSQIASLGRFVEFIEELLEGEHDWSPAEPDRDSEDAVEIMSVHKSKGLEFPVVFLAETNKQFNMRDTSGACLLDRDGTLGLKVIDGESKLGFKSLAHQVVAEEKSKLTVAEEMRILYVAMTRARERLYVCASKKLADCASVLRKCDEDKPMSFQTASVRCQFDWVLYGLGEDREFAKLFDAPPAPPMNTNMSNELFGAVVYDKEQMEKLASGILYGEESNNNSLPLPYSRGSVKELYEQVKAAMAWEYPHRADSEQHAKTSVTELTHKEDEFADVDLGGAFERVPEFMSEGKSGGAGSPGGAMAVGSATHLLMQKLGELQDVSRKDIEVARDRLVSDSLVPESVAKKINVDGVEAFYESELGTLMQSAENKVHSEWPFTTEVDGVIVQGIIDCLVETADGLVVIDFKTDWDIEKRQDKYRQQLGHYANAAEKVLGKKVVGKYLCFLNKKAVVEV